jgi:hypothetical protein
MEITLSNLTEILLQWWDFMDEDCTAQRHEYTREEQKELIDRFFLKIKLTSEKNESNLTEINFIAQQISDKEAKEAGYMCAPRWLVTNEEHQAKMLEKGMKAFEEWKKDELATQKIRDEYSYKEYTILNTTKKI